MHARIYSNVVVFLSMALIFAAGCEIIEDEMDDSEPSRTVLSAEGKGLMATYFANNNLSGSPELERVDGNVGFDWGRGAPDSSIDSNDFSVRWTGFVKAEFSETYTFYTYADDGMRVWIDDQLVVSDWSGHGPRERSGQISLEAGKFYSLKAEYFEYGGGAVCKLLWSSSRQSKEVIPNDNLFLSEREDLCPDDPDKMEQGECGCGVAEGTCNSQGGLKGTYFDNMDLTGQALERTDPVVNFDWGQGSPAPAIAKDSFSARWEGFVRSEFSETYTFYTVSDDGIRLWVDDKLIIDNWTNHPPTENKGTIALEVGKGHSIKIEYFENGGGAVAKLLWSSPSQSKQVIPQKQLATELVVDSLCVEAPEGKTAILTCPDGKTIATVDFSSYGLPTGACDSGFEMGSCHSTSSESKVEDACLGEQSCTVPASNGVFGDPCSGKYKKLTVAYSCQGADIEDQCPNDPNKTEPGECGCGVAEGTCSDPIITASGENLPREGKEKAFDGLSSTKWLTFADSGWIQYDFAGNTTKVITQYSITSANDSPERDPKDWKLLGSNDGTNYTTIDTRSGESFSVRFQKRTFNTTNSTAFKMYRLTIVSNLNPSAASSTQLAEIEMLEGEIADECPDDPNKTEPGECGCGVPEGSCDVDDPPGESCVVPSDPASSWQSSQAYCEHGQLRYATDDQGNRIPDFSYVGYNYGGELPEVPVVHTIAPVAGDNTRHIQEAINYIAENYSENSDGFRGALLLRPGVYSTDNPIYIPHSGIVLRGSGSGDDPSSDSIIRSTRTGRDEMVLHMGNSNGSENWDASVSGSRVAIEDAVVPIGETTFRVSDASKFRIGDRVVVRQEVNSAWYNAVDDGGTVSDPGWQERNFGWMDLSFTRYINQISGRNVTIDAPLYYRLDSNHGNLVLFKHNDSGTRNRLHHNLGVENLRMDIEYSGEVTGTDTDHTQRGIIMNGVIDGWVNNVAILHFSEEGVLIYRSTRVTVENTSAGPAVAPTQGGYKSGFQPSVGAQQILFRDCSAIATRHGFVLNGSTRSSGVVVLRGRLIDNIASSEGGHRQWSMGVLFDSCVVESGSSWANAFLLGNRGDWGTSHGWAAVNSVVWNTDTRGNGTIVVQQPPNAQNYAIGCSGRVNESASWPGPWGFTEGTNEERSLYPQSLYEAQLGDR